MYGALHVVTGRDSNMEEYGALHVVTGRDSKMEEYGALGDW